MEPRGRLSLTSRRRRAMMLFVPKGLSLDVVAASAMNVPVNMVPCKNGWVGGWGPRCLVHKRERGPVRVPSTLTED